MENLTFQLSSTDKIEVLADESGGTLKIEIVTPLGVTITTEYPCSQMILELFATGIFKAVKGDIDNLVQEIQDEEAFNEYQENEDCEEY